MKENTFCIVEFFPEWYVGSIEFFKKKNQMLKNIQEDSTQTYPFNILVKNICNLKFLNLVFFNFMIIKKVFKILSIFWKWR